MPRFNPTLCILLLASFTIGLANAARLLDSVPASLPVPGQFFPSGQIPAAVVPTSNDTDDDQFVDDSGSGPNDNAPVIAAASSVAAAGTGASSVPVTISVGSSVAAAGTGAGSVPVTTSVGSPTMSFFMHDILGGTQPTTRAVTGIIASAQINGIPFSKSNNQIFPINGATPLPTSFINNYRSTLPFLAGLNGAQNSAILQNNNNNAVTGGGNQPFVTAGNLPAGATLQQLMFGSITVIDDELTEGHELGSGVIGRAQGFYLASSLDGTSHTFAFTALLGNDEHHDGADDTISFFGVHRTASVVSHIAVVGGTGKYENAKGYATIEPMHQLDQHITDGVDTVFQFHVYL